MEPEGNDEGAPVEDAEAAPVEGGESGATDATDATEGGEEVVEVPNPSDDVTASLFAVEDAPGSMTALDAILEKEGMTSFKVSQEQFDGLSIEAKQLIHNLRGMASRAASNSSREQQAARAAQESAKTERAKLETERAKLYSMFKDPKIMELMKTPEGEPPDPFTEEGVNYRAKLASQAFMKDFLDKIGEVSDDQLKAIEQESATATRETARTELRAFRKDNPEFEKHKDEIVSFLKQVDYKVDFKEAFEIVMARKGIPTTKPKGPKDVRRARSAAQRGTTRSRNPPQNMPKVPSGPNVTAWEINRFYADNPEVQKEDLRRHLGGKGSSY